MRSRISFFWSDFITRRIDSYSHAYFVLLLRSREGVKYMRFSILIKSEAARHYKKND